MSEVNELGQDLTASIRTYVIIDAECRVPSVHANTNRLEVLFWNSGVLCSYFTFVCDS